MQKYFENSDVRMSPRDQEQCELMMSMVKEKAPLQSIISVKMAHLPNGTYHTIFEAKALCGVFQSEAQHSNLVFSFRRALRHLLIKIQNWSIISISLNAPEPEKNRLSARTDVLLKLLP